MANQFSRYDPAQDLLNHAALEMFMNDALETGDATHIAAALSVVARARGLAPLAGKPTLESTLELLTTLGLKLSTSVICPS